MSKAEDILERNKASCARRDLWMPLWQELADLLYPNRGGFTAPMLPGRETQIEIYDTTPMQARRGLATAIDGMMKPATSRWFWMAAADDAINEDDEAKRWFDAVGDRMWSAIYDPLARFIQHSGAVDNDLSAFGLGYLWIGDNRARNGLVFRSLHIGDSAIDENADGQVDTIYITRRFTARQAQQRFGDKAPPKVKEALAQGASQAARNKLFSFVQGIYPREDRDQRRADNQHFPFETCIVSSDDDTVVEESGYQEFPVAVPRWEVSANEIYPRSPGMMALPDARTLQAMGHTLLVGGQRAIDPPTWVAEDAALSAVRTFPGGLTVVDANVVRDTGGKPIGQLEMGANIPVGREMQQDYRQMVEAAFFRNVFNLPDPASAGKMTAYEVGQRKEEFLRTIGPTLGQLENDYIGVIVRRVFGVMSGPMRDFKGGQLPLPPEILQGREVNFEFMSPIQQARKQIEAAGMSQAMQFITPIAEFQPEALDNIDGDEIMRDVPSTFFLPHKWFRPKDKVDALRAQRAQHAQSAGALAQGQQLADVAKTVADAGHSEARAKAMAADTQSA